MSLFSRPLSVTSIWLLLATFGTMWLSPACAEEAAAEKAEDAKGEEDDETKALLKKMTIAMISEVLDERTVVVRNTGDKSKKRETHLRLGNVGEVPRGSLDDGEYAEKKKVAKEALQKMVDKQMIWFKEAPESLQAPASPGAEPDLVIADIWSIEGKHVSAALKADGHLEAKDHYKNEIGEDILSVRNEAEKKESYKKLEEALKESEKAKKEAAAAAAAEAQKEYDEANVEPIGIAGWIGLAVVGLIVLGVATNFGRPSSSKSKNMNRPKSRMEKVCNYITKTVSGKD